MKYKIGDKVRIKISVEAGTFLEAPERTGTRSDWIGRVGTVTEVDHDQAYPYEVKRGKFVCRFLARELVLFCHREVVVRRLDK